MTDKKNKSNDKTSEEREGHQFPTENELDEAMKEWKMEPSDKMKRKSLQRAMDGIGEARRESIKKKKVVKMKRWSQGLIAGAVAVALFSLIVLNTDEFKNLFGADADSTGNNRENVEQQVDNNQDEANETEEPVDTNEHTDETNDLNDTDETNETNETNDARDETSEFPEVDRPETKEITTRVEGMEEVNTYNLLNEPSMPFTTYIRDNYHYEMLDKEYGEGLTISQKDSSFIVVDIVFFDDEINYDQALEHVEHELDGMGNVERLPEGNLDSLDEWAMDGFYYAGDVLGRVAVGTSENDRVFYIYTHFIEEAMDGWLPVKEVIVDEWEWKETGERLMEG